MACSLELTQESGLQGFKNKQQIGDEFKKKKEKKNHSQACHLEHPF